MITALYFHNLRNLVVATLSLIVCSCTLKHDEQTQQSVTVMSLNIYGWKTMPEHSDDYASLIKRHNIDILGIQEGVEDWRLKLDELDSRMRPTNYWRAETLKVSLGECWHHHFQIFINHCQGNRFVHSGRFDLTDGPNATRTGEYAIVSKMNTRYLIVNIHWDHESAATRQANALETSTMLEQIKGYPKILIGDFNSRCDSGAASYLSKNSPLVLLANVGVDCLFVEGLHGEAYSVPAYPSDHPAIVATLTQPLIYRDY